MIKHSAPLYPFAAIVGHERLKMALLLATVDPKIGGVLISGPRGTAKTTAARALSCVLPNQGQFITLPLGATEDRLIGSLQLERILDDGKVEFSPGLLHAAHNGILYVDEINLLPDHLVDLLLDVAASGVNIIERESVSHQHPAQILLIGTMNPDEGELRPQLIDRFGFFISLPPTCPTQQKVEIIKRRLAFDQNPLQFIDEYEGHENALKARCTKARAQLSCVKFDETYYQSICEMCSQSGAEGMRADLVIMRAARAYAAWQGKGCVDQEDIDYVAPLALAHRQKLTSNMKPSSTKPLPENSPQENGDKQKNDWGELPPQPVATGPFRILPADAKKKIS